MRELKTIVTTAGRPDEQSLPFIQYVCEALEAPFVERKKRSVKKIAQAYDAHIIVAGKNRYEYYPKGTTVPFFFHPNSAAFRLKRVARGEHDPFLQAVNLQAGESFLDCTLGMGADAMLAAYQVGAKGRIVGLEANANVAFIVKTGMAVYDTTKLPLTSCMRQIEVVHAEAIAYLKNLPDNSFDVVYMDPMFEEVIEEANNFDALREAGSHSPLCAEWVNEARRVARKRIVLKAHFRSTLFEQFGFQREMRAAAKFHFGVMVL